MAVGRAEIRSGREVHTRMTKTLRVFVVAIFAVASAFAWLGAASADVTNSSADNQQTGDNTGSATQSGTSTSGDAVGGMVTGVVSSGRASVDAKNRSEDINIKTGKANSANHVTNFTGLNDTSGTNNGNNGGLSLGDIASSTGDNQQDGDNDFDVTQTSTASSGDGVGGTVEGVVTSAGGSAAIVSDNASKKVSIKTGTADAASDSVSFVGLNDSNNTSVTDDALADVSSSTGDNQQTGDNSLSGTQTSNATTGDGVGGLVLGDVSAGSSSIDAKNRSEKISITTGVANAASENVAFVGLNDTTSGRGNNSGGTTLSDVTTSTADNQQDGDNDGTFDQTSNASSGDGVGGLVSGVVTSAGGSAREVLDNASKKISAKTGTTNDLEENTLFFGLNDGSSDFTAVI